MLKTSRWPSFVSQDEPDSLIYGFRENRQCSPEERHRLATAPFPAIHVHVPSHGSHAMGGRKFADYRDYNDYTTTKGDK